MQQQWPHNTEGAKSERQRDLFTSFLQVDNPKGGQYVYI